MNEFHGYVYENNVELLGRQYLEDLPRHGIGFVGFHSPFGIPQPVSFEQVGPACWKGTHRNGETIHMVLQPKIDDAPLAPPAALTAVILALPDGFVDLDSEWVVLPPKPRRAPPKLT